MHLDKPEGKPDDKVAWGSDIAAQMLRRFGKALLNEIEKRALTPR